MIFSKEVYLPSPNPRKKKCIVPTDLVWPSMLPYQFGDYLVWFIIGAAIASGGKLKVKKDRRQRLN